MPSYDFEFFYRKFLFIEFYSALLSRWEEKRKETGSGGETIARKIIDSHRKKAVQQMVQR